MGKLLRNAAFADGTTHVLTLADLVDYDMQIASWLVENKPAQTQKTSQSPRRSLRGECNSAPE
jgi:hypothetical protein